MDTLEKLFDSNHRAKIMKLFLFNPDHGFPSKTVANKVKAREKDVRREISLLEKIRFVKRKTCRNSTGRSVSGYAINPQFKYIEPLRDFLIKVSPFSNESLVRKLSQAGRLKLVVVSGVFLHEFDARVDLLVVADRTKKNIFDKVMKEIEAEMGREIHYALLEGEDFEYRLGIGDKLVRDIFDYNHEVIFNKIGLVE